MQLHNLKTSKPQRSQRVGRGGKRGSYSGRGVKGQKSRSGRKMRPASRDLIMRLPKHRGFKNKPMHAPTVVINVGQLNAAKVGQEPLTVLSMKALKLVSRRYRGKVKILGTGEINFPMTVSGILVSKSARAKIEKAGGKVIQKVENSK